MIITQSSKDKYLKEISSLIGKSNAAKGADLSDLSCHLRREIHLLIPVLEALIRDGLISVHVKSGHHKSISAPDNPEKQIKLLRNALTASTDLPDALYLKKNTTVTITINQSKL